MSGRIRLDDAGPGEPATPSQIDDRQRTPAEPQGRSEEVSATPGAEASEEGHERPADGGAGDPAADPEQAERERTAEQRIRRLTREKYEAEERARQAEQRWQQMQQQQRQQQTPPGPERDAEERAYQRFQGERQEQLFAERCNALWIKGVAQYGDAEMREAKAALDAVGWGNTPTALWTLTELPDGHRVYRELASDLDNAARILSLPHDQRTAALAVMAHRPTNPRAPEDPDRGQAEIRATRAPEPLRPVGGNSMRPEKPLDQVSMAEFIRRRDRDERGSRIRR